MGDAKLQQPLNHCLMTTRAATDPKGRSHKATQEIREQEEQQYETNPLLMDPTIPLTPPQSQPQSQPQPQDQAGSQHFQHQSHTQRSKKRRKKRRRRVDRNTSKHYNLVLDVNQLKAEIAHLQRRQSCLLQKSQRLTLRTSPHGSLVRAIRYYYELFQYGAKVPEGYEEQTAPPAQHQQDAVTVPVKSHSCSLATDFSSLSCLAEMATTEACVHRFYQRQHEYLQWLFTDRFLRGKFPMNVDLLMEQWQKANEIFQNFEIQLTSCQVIDVQDSPIVWVKARTFTRITRNTLINMFPVVLQDEMLTQQMIGQVFEMEAMNFYYFDHQNKVVRHDVGMEMTRGLMQIIHHARKAQRVLQNARTNDQFILTTVVEQV